MKWCDLLPQCDEFHTSGTGVGAEKIRLLCQSYSLLLCVYRSIHLLSAFSDTSSAKVPGGQRKYRTIGSRLLDLGHRAWKWVATCNDTQEMEGSEETRKSYFATIPGQYFILPYGLSEVLDPQILAAGGLAQATARGENRSRSEMKRERQDSRKRGS